MTYRRLDELHTQYAERGAAIRQRLKEYAAVPESMYFYELLYCLMTPQSSAVNAGKAQRMFEAADYRHRDIDPLPLLYRPEYYIRFHRTKARHIAAMKLQYAEIHAVAVGPMNASEKREWLVRNVKGLSYKEATHFLRNIGRNGGLTILDRHILRSLQRYGVIRTIPDVLTKKQYIRIERAFLRFAEATGITSDELDLLFWSAATGEILK